MLNIWSTETTSLSIAAVGLVLLGLLSGNWFVASLITLGIYIFWLYRRMLKLERWIRKGTRASEVFEDKGFVGVIIRQLQQQKKTHNRRKRRTKKILHQMKENISALPDATVLLNDELRIEWCNDPARYLLNLRSPQDLGNKLKNIIRDPSLLAYLENSLGQEHIEINSPLDAKITVQVRKVSLAANKSLLIARNISDQKQLQESLKNFVANASHELRSPLTVIWGHLEMLEGEQEISESGKRSLHIAQRQTERMKELIQDLLLLSQVESYHLAIDEGDRVSISELKTGLLEALEKYDDRHRVHLDFPAHLFIRGINIEIQSICINLVENAIKYSTPDKPIRVRWFENSSAEYVFNVEDQGSGIAQEEISQLTNRHYRGQKSRAEVSGSGLGLAIVQHAANKHGAVFEIVSEPGKGSCFSVTFPSYRCLRDDRHIHTVSPLANH
ncbi:phosphate regulon sensor protein PhoR [Draconibacterium sp.]|nr:phosphate regulon sensor protein PhoR [Draconibacterium sp.]